MHRPLTRPQIAAQVARDIPEGAYVNIGVGMPEGVAAHLPPDREIVLQSENGILGMGPPPPEGEVDWELVNAGKAPVTLLPGGAYFHHADSFAMMRGGHLDIAILGGYQVACNGDLANWSLARPGIAPAVGGAMDLAVGAKRLFIMMEHVMKDGSPKLVERCTYPLTGIGVVSRIFTDLAIVDVTSEGFQVEALVEGLSRDQLQAMTGAPLRFAPNLRLLT